MTRRLLLAGTASLVGMGCATQGTQEKDDDVQMASGVEETSGEEAAVGAIAAAELINVFDMHADTTYVLGMVPYEPYADFTNKFSGTLASTNARGSADCMGDFGWVQCYAVWIPDTEGDLAPDISLIEWYRKAAAWFREQVDKEDGRFIQVCAFSEIPEILPAGKVAAILTVENAACLSEGIEVVDEFAQDGVLISGLTWNYKYALGAGNECPDVGLTDLGRDFIWPSRTKASSSIYLISTRRAFGRSRR